MKTANMMDQPGMWYTSPAADTPDTIHSAKDAVSVVLAYLHALQWNHQASHWQSEGDASYGDHLLFQRLYDAVTEEIDGLAEKMVGLYGNTAVDAKTQAVLMPRVLSRWAHESDPFKRALLAEDMFQVALKATVELPLGLDNMLRTLADTHETHLYLLQQRRGGVKLTVRASQKALTVRVAFSQAARGKMAGWWVGANADPLKVSGKPRDGWIRIDAGGDIQELTTALNKYMVAVVPSPQQVDKVTGAVKAFSFHWSNAQNKWDVISAKGFPWGIDGAEFIVFVGKNALSPLGKPWGLAEMSYVAKSLHRHPGA